MEEYIGGQALVFTKPDKDADRLITRNIPDPMLLFRGFSTRVLKDEILVGGFSIKFPGGISILEDGIRRG